jgi:hypothetical protein
MCGRATLTIVVSSTEYLLTEVQIGGDLDFKLQACSRLALTWEEGTPVGESSTDAGPSSR